MPRSPESHIANVLIRSGLFGVTRYGTNQDAGKWRIQGWNLSIALEGRKLSQKDLDVWLVCLKEGVRCLGQPVPFGIRRALGLLGLNPNGRSSAGIRESLIRLNQARISITQGDACYDGRLIHTLNRDLSGNRFIYSLDPGLVNLWLPGYTRINMTHRARLGRNQYAKWLHAYFSSFDRVRPHSFEALRMLCGCEEKSIYGFKRKIVTASKIIEKNLGYAWGIDSRDRYFLRFPERE